MKNKRRMRRHWYFVVCVEMEAIVEADYPRTAEDSLHDVVHQMLDPIDRHHFPRVWLQPGWQRHALAGNADAVRPGEGSAQNNQTEEGNNVGNVDQNVET